MDNLTTCHWCHLEKSFFLFEWMEKVWDFSVSPKLRHQFYRKNISFAWELQYFERKNRIFEWFQRQTLLAWFFFSRSDAHHSRACKICMSFVFESKPGFDATFSWECFVAPAHNKYKNMHSENMLNYTNVQIWRKKTRRNRIESVWLFVQFHFTALRCWFYFPSTLF